MSAGPQPPGAVMADVKTRRRCKPQHTDPVAAQGAAATHASSGKVSAGLTPTATAPIRQATVIGPFLDDSDIVARFAKRHGSLEHFFCKSFPAGRRPVPRPLANSSNFCFLNAIVQALVCVPCVAHACAMTAEMYKLAPVLSTLGSFLRLRYWRAGSAVLVAPRLPVGPLGAGSGSGSRAVGQEDASEFLVCLLAQMELEMNAVEAQLVASAAGNSSPSPSSTTTPAGGGGKAQRGNAFPSEPPPGTPPHGTGGGGKKSKKKQPAGGGDASSEQDGDEDRWVTVGKTKKHRVVARHDAAAPGGGGGGGSSEPSTSNATTPAASPASHTGDTASSAPSLFPQIMGGVVSNALRGGRGIAKSVTSVVYEPFSSVSIAVGFAAQCTVEEALARAFLPESIQDDTRGVAMKKVSLIEQLPQVLVLTVRRWAVTAEGDIVKIDNQLQYSSGGSGNKASAAAETEHGGAGLPSATRLVVPATCCAQKLTPQQRSYQLTSVVCHRGDGMMNGHYVTYIVGDEPPAASSASLGGGGGAASATPPPAGPEVLLCNDASISRSTLRQLEKECAYLLFYSRVAQGGSAH